MSTIDLSTGTKIDLANPSLESVSIVDIASSLSKICRFTGHSTDFYSVAQHSVLASHICRGYEAQFAVLMHDAHEAFCGDVSSPLKAMLTDYQAIEKRLQKLVQDRFNIGHENDDLVRVCDLKMLATEKRDLLANSHTFWEVLKNVEPLSLRIIPWDHALAKKMFLRRFNELNEQREQALLAS
jgi:uncharacterized protein